ncbi:MAG: glycosyl hydrolase family 17 protein [Planctomycetota bacterium]
MLRTLTALTFAAITSAAAAQVDDPRPYVTEIDRGWIAGGISYGPFRDGQGPGGEAPTEAQLLEDLQLLSERWTLIRMYGSRGPAETVCRLLVEHDIPMKIMVGAWIDSEHVVNDDGTFGEPIPENAAINRQEVDTAIRLANEFPSVVHAINIGNESQVFWSAHRVRQDVLINYIRQTRAATTVPVTTFDDYNFWNKPEARAVADEVDVIGWHAYAMWNQQELVNALSWTREQLAEVRTLYPEAVIVHGETGWATSTDPNADPENWLITAPAGEREQELFFRTYTAWADEAGLPYFYFSAFDENWKGGPSPTEVEKHWGLYFSDRTPKLALQTRASAERGGGNSPKAP